MKPSLQELLPDLRCPATGGQLALDGGGWLVSIDGRRRYPVIDGVPVLIAGEQSLFDSASSQMWGRSALPERRITSVAKWLLRLPPTSSRNVGSLDNYRELRRLLHDRATSSGLPGSLLVVGGGDAGVGTHEILADPDLTIVETDVYLGPRTQVVCDAHDLPFPDGSFDAVICQAALEHVIDPSRVANEIWRVLKPGGFVYSEVPFMQQVHAGAFDFTRFTLVGHRLLWRSFDELRSGAHGGPGMALIWSVVYFLRALVPRRLWPLADRLGSLSLFWLKYFDGYLVRRPGGLDAASGTYFLGSRRESRIADRDIVRGYRGGGPALDW